MKDILGHDLAIGDVVAFPSGNGHLGSMFLGEIIRIGEKMVIIGPAKHAGSTRRSGVKRYPQDVVRVQL